MAVEFVSNRAAYAILVVKELQAAKAALSQEEVAARIGVTNTYAQHFLRGLMAAGIIVSKRGRDRGYRLADPKRIVTVFDVIEAMTTCEESQNEADTPLGRTAKRIDAYVADALRKLEVSSV